MQIATDTRDESFYNIDSLNTKQSRVYETIAAGQPLSDRDIAGALGWPINCVTGRRNELVALGIVSPAGDGKDSLTQRRVKLWKVSPATDISPS